MEEKTYACEEHVDLALEAAAEATLAPPHLEKVSHAQNSSTACEYCKNPAIYVVSNTHSHTEC